MEVLITRLDDFGRGIGHIDGKVCFIPNAYPGEIVDVEITCIKKNYLEGRVLNYAKTSEHRNINTECHLFDFCGGCQFLNYDFSKENEYKTNKVKMLMERIAHIDSTIVEDIKFYNEVNYRNKVVFHVVGKKIGFYKEKTNDLVEVSNCLLLREEINRLIPKLKEIVADDRNKVAKIMVRVANNSSDTMVCFYGSIDNYCGINSDLQAVYLNERLIFGSPLVSHIGDKKFYVSPGSFFQINTTVVKYLYDEILNYCLNSHPTNVLDLYCGTGSIGIYISRCVERVLGIDCCKSSIDDANKNMILNDVNNVSFLCNKVEDVIDKIEINFDLVVVDPPRAGLDKKTIEYLKKINSKSIIYVSCNPATLARDIDRLSDIYVATSIKPFNMFPKTYHCESIVVLERK